jgi:hypothetical protein
MKFYIVVVVVVVVVVKGGCFELAYLIYVQRGGSTNDIE